MVLTSYCSLNLYITEGPIRSELSTLKLQTSLCSHTVCSYRLACAVTLSGATDETVQSHCLELQTRLCSHTVCSYRLASAVTLSGATD
ncbi:hypothetical protein DPMN_187064 [Dreissena polymorpha]|uniref:Uncharacterized protein n=1 Tax=Dreissena polymorpha TaxID=45954 RepID=A0A9D4DMM8_DREPO|nr:hypothetical protein DPMN_187064 [Dreissena polymorpha]